MIEVLLFKTTHCVKCHSLEKPLQNICKDHNVEFTAINVEENPTVIDIRKLISVPVVIIIDENENELIRWTNYVSQAEFEATLVRYKDEHK